MGGGEYTASRVPLILFSELWSPGSRRRGNRPSGYTNSDRQLRSKNTDDLDNRSFLLEPDDSRTIRTHARGGESVGDRCQYVVRSTLQ